MMDKTIDAVFDGKVFHPKNPVALEPNTNVRISVEPVQPDETENTPKNGSFLDALLSAQIEDGPPDWSVNLDHYLYGTDKRE